MTEEEIETLLRDLLGKREMLENQYNQIVSDQKPEEYAATIATLSYAIREVDVRAETLRSVLNRTEIRFGFKLN